MVSDEELELGSLHVGGLDRRAIEQFLKTGTRGQVEGFLNEYFQSFGKNIQSLLFRQYVTNEGISLNSVAASVNLSPNHFSTIFSQETGQTFIEFLTSVRMEKAKELLRSTSMKTAEVAFAVGYKDPHYFSYLFKKTQECTPREFRSKA